MRNVGQAGIGPHSEAQTLELICRELQLLMPSRYADAIRLGAPYPEALRQKCDLCIGLTSKPAWAMEVKLLRFLGDNGKLNDNIVMHILSPYPAHRSALSDCMKLASYTLGERKAIVIYGYSAPGWPLEPAIEAFEALARHEVSVGPRQSAGYQELVHPVHQAGQVFAWEIAALRRPARGQSSRRR